MRKLIVDILENNCVQKTKSGSLADIIIDIVKNDPLCDINYINGKEIISNGYFLYDGCHKIYIPKNQSEIDDLKTNCGYIQLPLKLLPLVYEKSCPLRFINSADLCITYVEQFAGPVKFT